MKNLLKIVFLELIILATGMAIIQYSPPVMDSLPQYSLNSYTIRWMWNDSAICGADACNIGCSSCTGNSPNINCPCFENYEINESGSNNNIYNVSDKAQKSMQLDNRVDGLTYYKVRVFYNITHFGDTIQVNQGTATATGWSNTVSTTVDSTPPSLTIYTPYNGSSYQYGSIVSFYVNSYDISGFTTSLYVDDTIKNQTINSSPLMYRASDFSAGVHTFYATAFNGVGLSSRDPPINYKYFKINQSSAQNCSDNTPYGQCSLTKPNYCNPSGQLVHNCTFCGCPAGQSCNETTNYCYTPYAIKCPDNTAAGQCSVTKPKYCQNGNLIDYCQLCGCLSPWKCQSIGSCTLCGNGNCETGESESCCRDCGCTAGFLCNTTTDLCYSPAAPASYIQLLLISPKDTVLTFSPGQDVSFIFEVRDENNRTVSDADVLLYPSSENYTSSSMGDGLYTISYKIKPYTNDSFQISVRAKKQDQLSQAMTFFISISKFLDIRFLTPQQNQTVSESWPVEAKIVYPDGSAVLTGDFYFTIENVSYQLSRNGSNYVGFLNVSNQTYGRKDIYFTGQDPNGNSLASLLVIQYVEKINFVPYVIAVLLVTGCSGLAYLFYSYRQNIYSDYQALRQQKDYLVTMDKRTHLEFFKRHIDEPTFKKLVLEYQQKLTDVEKVMAEIEKKHSFVRKIKNGA